MMEANNNNNKVNKQEALDSNECLFVLVGDTMGRISTSTRDAYITMDIECNWNTRYLFFSRT